MIFDGGDNSIVHPIVILGNTEFFKLIGDFHIMSSCTFLGFHESGCFDFFKCHIGEVIDSLSPSVNVAVFVMFPDGSNFVEKEVKPVDRGFVEWRFELGVNFGDLFKT